MARGVSKKVKQGALSDTELLQLRNWNRWLAVILAVEGVIIFLFSAAYSIPVIVNYLSVSPINSAAVGHTVLAPSIRQLFNVSVTGLVTLFLLVAALAHGLQATVCRKGYESGLTRGVNKIRWISYAASAGLMLALIGLLSGVYDFGTLIAIFGFMVVMNLLGLIAELTSSESRAQWLAYWGGAVAGFVPWLIIALYAFSAAYYGAAHIPTFVYWIYCTMLVCTAGFAINAYLNFKKWGRWASYAYTERAFMILGLVTESLLAWQIFVGVLRP
jgi:hypothetical protein